MFDALFLAMGALFGWRIARAARTGCTTYRGFPCSRATAPLAFWFVTGADIVFLGAAIYGLWLGAHP